jgi:heat shock protein HslJ
MKRCASLMAVMVLVGCTHASRDATALRGKDWRLSEIDGKAIAASADHQPSLMLPETSDSASGSGGCNEYGATFSLKAEALNFSTPMASKRGCASEINAVEQAFFQALQNVATHRVEGAQLELLDAKGKVLMRLRAM